MRTFLIIAMAGLASIQQLTAQILTKEDSLQAKLIQKDAQTVLSGYGEISYENNLTNKEATANLNRAVLFVGHRFNDKISFFSELEVEDAKVDAEGGEISLEQCYLKFEIGTSSYISAGLFLPRIGIINENHLPTTFFGNNRPYTETMIIPSTWREIGIGFYTQIPSVRGLNFSLALTNGLNGEEIKADKGLRDARFEGRDASARNLALSSSLLYYINDFRIQASGYFGGSVGLNPRMADSLQLESSAFGTPVTVLEADATWKHNGISFRALATMVNISKAEDLNRAFANNCPEQMNGYYLEAGYNMLKLFNASTQKDLSLFARWESVNRNAKMPSNGIKNDINNRQYLICGLNYAPARGVVLKADITLMKTGEPNPLLVVNPFPQAPEYHTSQTIAEIGLGYSF